MEVFLIILGIVAFLITIFFIIFDEAILIFWYLVDKRNYKNKLIRKFTKKNQSIYIIGSIHGGHFRSKDYSHMHLKAALENIKPDLLLVESRQEEVENGNLGDGPFEMLYLHLLAKDLGIPVKGIDWFKVNNDKPGTTTNERDEKITQNIVRESEGYKKVLVVVGAAHMIIDSKKLRKRGYKRIRLCREDLRRIYTNIDDEMVYHADTIKYIEKRIECEKNLLETIKLDEVWRTRIEMIVDKLEKFTVIVEEYNKKDVA
ncbi:hypothetical protein RJG79_10350 [Mycoplasmatota bacterium WC44]